MKTTTKVPWAIGLVLALLIAACSGGPQSVPSNAAPVLSESERLTLWLDQQYEQELQFSPIELSFLGRRELNDQLDDFSLQGEDERLLWKKNSVAEMQRQFDYEALSKQAKTSYDLWLYQYEADRLARQWSEHVYVFNRSRGLHNFLPTFLLNFHSIDDEQSLNAYVSRLRAAGRAMDQVTARAKQAASQGIRSPRFAYDDVIGEIGKLLQGAPFDAGEPNPLLQKATQAAEQLQASASISPEAATAVIEQARLALLDSFGPAFRRSMDWLQTDRDNTDAQARGVWALPGGGDYYQAQLKLNTTTDLAPDTIHQIGLQEVARLRAEMETIKNQVGFEGDLQAFFAFIREDKQFFFDNDDVGRQAYISAAEGFLAEIDSKLPQYFGLMPKASLVVKRVEAFREQDGAAQHYFPGSPDGARPGVYYVHLSDMTAMPTNQIENIAYHEGNPGHHMQISIAQELTGIPVFRTQAGFTAYSEGWGLYSELLAREMGGYSDPYSNFGRLTGEIWRAIRLVVDTGMHSQGWTEEQAVKYFMANSPEPETSVRSEIQRYLVIPGQATSYKIGMLKILELRAQAQQQLGDKFDIRGFHDAVLGGGALPLSLLSRRVQQWVDIELAKP